MLGNVFTTGLHLFLHTRRAWVIFVFVSLPSLVVFLAVNPALFVALMIALIQAFFIKLLIEVVMSKFKKEKMVNSNNEVRPLLQSHARNIKISLASMERKIDMISKQSSTPRYRKKKSDRAKGVERALLKLED